MVLLTLIGKVNSTIYVKSVPDNHLTTNTFKIHTFLQYEAKLKLIQK